MTRSIIKGMGSGVKKAKPKGQVAILFALVFTFMFVLFAFVVDVGHLVNNKINLQIAADAAAYAGAAWQARLLNQMGQINYHMRQDIKEMAMRVQVTHTRHNRNFPRGNQFISGGDGAPRGFYPFVCQQAHGYRALSGLRYNVDTNICRNASPEFGGIPPIVVPPVIATFDPFAVAISAQIRRIQEKANQECTAAAKDNKQLVEHLARVYSNRSQFHAKQMQAMADYLNSMDDDDDVASSEHPAVKTAYESARRNLTMANRDGFKMEILKPDGGSYVEMLEQRLNAALFYYDFQVQSNSCIGQPAFLRSNGEIVAGFYKRPEILTYFTIKLSAKPQMLFMPQPWAEAAFPTLEAISTAKPFGSRLGPPPNSDQLLPIPNRPGNQSPFINFSTRPRDSLGIMNTKLMAYYDALMPFNRVSAPEGNQDNGWPTMDRGENLRTALQAIRTPTIFDAAFFTIYPDPGPNIQADYLEPDYAEVLYPDYLEAAGPNNQIIQTPDPVTEGYLPGDVGSRNRGQGWIQINADRRGGNPGYGPYAEESVGTHSVTGPSFLPGVAGQETKFGFASTDMIHSGWSPLPDTGRIGYSVKFIGLQTIIRGIQMRTTSGETTFIANPPTGDPNIQWVDH